MKSVSGSINLLAHKYRAPLAMVERLIDEETARISAEARVTSFVPIIAARRVEERLRSHADFGHGTKGQPAEASA